MKEESRLLLSIDRFLVARKSSREAGLGVGVMLCY